MAPGGIPVFPAIVTAIPPFIRRTVLPMKWPTALLEEAALRTRIARQGDFPAQPIGLLQGIQASAHLAVLSTDMPGQAHRTVLPMKRPTALLEATALVEQITLPADRTEGDFQDHVGVDSPARTDRTAAAMGADTANNSTQKPPANKQGVLFASKILLSADPLNMTPMLIKRAGKSMPPGIIRHKIQGIKVRLRVQHGLHRFYTWVTNRPGG